MGHGGVRGAGKIYEQTASKMFHIPIEEITKGSPYRVRGKVASLACQYGGAEGALVSMGALNFCGRRGIERAGAVMADSKSAHC